MKPQYFCIFMHIWWFIKCLVNKSAACTRHCSLWHEHRHWGFVITGYIFVSMIQARAIPSPSWGSAPRVITGRDRVSNGRPHLQLYRKSANFSLFMTIYDYIFRLRQKGVLFDKSIPLAAEFIYLATSAECTGSINRPTTVKWLIMLI